MAAKKRRRKLAADSSEDEEGIAPNGDGGLASDDDGAANAIESDTEEEDGAGNGEKAGEGEEGEEEGEEEDGGKAGEGGEGEEEGEEEDGNGGTPRQGRRRRNAIDPLNVVEGKRSRAVATRTEVTWAATQSSRRGNGKGTRALVRQKKKAPKQPRRPRKLFSDEEELRVRPRPAWPPRGS